MKAQMKFQKYICLAMLIVGALGLVYAFVYGTGGLSELGQNLELRGGRYESAFVARNGKNDATLFTDIQGFNTMLMYFGIVMVLGAVLLYITATNKRRNYYVSNYVATGICAGANVILSVVALVMNGIWRGKFLNVDFDAWQAFVDETKTLLGETAETHFSDSTAFFDLGFAVYIIIIIASVFLILNLIWKIKLMQGEKQLLAGNELAGGEAV